MSGGSRSPELVIRAGGRTYGLMAGRSATIGRDGSCDIKVSEPATDGRHASVSFEGSRWVVRPVGSSAMFLKGSRVLLCEVTSHTEVNLGTPNGGLVEIWPAPAPPHKDHPRPAAGSGRAANPGDITIGRAPNNTTVVNDLTASRHHAQLTIASGSAVITDLGSSNGTFVNGQRVRRSYLSTGDKIGIGNLDFVFTGTGLDPVASDQGLSFSAHGVTVTIGGKELVHDVSFQLPPKSLLAVVGPSGSGKSTLLAALTGQRPPESGTVMFADRDLYEEYDQLRSRIGLVPQSDLLHSTLPVRKALEYGATLRFPADTTAAERASRVEQVMNELGIAGRADLRIDKLSGGQRKRASVALELLTKPSLLFLDEPTSGLDPGLDQQVMSLLRNLADDGRVVVVVTHSVSNLAMCDSVMVLAEGGQVAYAGPPGQALPYFGVASWAEVFTKLEQEPGHVLHERFVRSPHGSRAGATRSRPTRSTHPPVSLEPIRRQPRSSQLMTLSRRYVEVIASDRGYLRLLVLMPLVLAVLGHAATDEMGLAGQSPAAPLNPHARSVLMVLLLGAVFMGTAISIQEIVKEKTIYARERAVGLSMSAYLGSKIVVLGCIAILQGAVFSSLALLGRPPPMAPLLIPYGRVEVTLLVSLLTVVCMTFGLAISAFINGSDVAMPALVVMTMGQIILSGAVPIGMDRLIEWLGWMAPAYWCMGALAGTTGLDALAAIPASEQQWNWATETGIWVTNVAMLLLEATVAVGIASVGLRRLDPKRRTKS